MVAVRRRGIKPTARSTIPSRRNSLAQSFTASFMAVLLQRHS